MASLILYSKQFTQRSPILGLLPKQKIFNQDGESLTNFKKGYPSTMSISSDIDTRIDIEEIQGSPDGVHFNFAPSLHNGVHALSRTLNFQFIGTGGSQIDILNGEALNVEDDNAHIIADGIYNAYVDYDFAPDHQSTNIRRRNGRQNLVVDTIRKGRKADGTIIDVLTSPTVTGRLSNYDTIAASTLPIYGNNFKIHFLNPSAKDSSYGHFADFAISVIVLTE